MGNSTNGVGKDVFELYRETTDEKIDELKSDVNQFRQEYRSDMGDIKQSLTAIQQENNENRTWKKIGGWLGGGLLGVLMTLIGKFLGL